MLKTLCDINSNYVLELASIKYEILSVAGRGGSSFVYKAKPLNGNNNDIVMIKEFCPDGFVLLRGEDGSINITELKRNEFMLFEKRINRESEIAQFLRVYDGNNDDYIFACDNPVYTNGTWYTVVRTSSGEMLSNLLESKVCENFYAICGCMILILDALESLHNKNVLHLDISPDNIHFANSNIARLIDFNSAYRIDDERFKDMVLSTKQGYSAYELTNPSLKGVSGLSFATDLYSVAAVFFKLLFNRTPQGMDRRYPEDSWVKTLKYGHLKGASSALLNETINFIYNSISLLKHERCQTVDEMRNIFNKLQSMSINPELVHSPVYQDSNYRFREETFKLIYEKLKQNGYVILYGMPGEGKTVVAKMYAKKFEEKYEFIQFVTFCGKLEDTIANSLQFRNFDATMYDKYKEDKTLIIYNDKMNILKNYKIEKRNVLIIIDDYNTDLTYDAMFREFISQGFDVIFTSNEKRKGCSDIEILPLNNQEQYSLFLHHYENNNISSLNETVIKGIIEDIRGNTMMIVLIASALRDTPAISPVEMRNRLRGSIDPKVYTKFSVEKDGINHHDKDIYQHIVTLFNIKKIVYNESYTHLMAIMSLINSNGIKKTDLHRWATPERTDDFTDINNLCRLGWMICEKKLDGEYIFLHRLIRKVMRDQLNHNDIDYDSISKGYIELLYELQKTSSVERLIDGTTLKWLCQYIDISKENEYTRGINEEIGDALYKSGHYFEAISYHSKAAHICANIYGLTDPKMPKLWDKSADDFFMWYGFIKIDEIAASCGLSTESRNEIVEQMAPASLQLYFMALAWRKSNIDEHSPSIIHSFSNISGAFFRLEAYEEAIKFGKRALKFNIKLYGKNDLVNATLYGNISLYYWRLKRKSKAMKYYLKADAICKVCGTTLKKEHRPLYFNINHHENPDDDE